MNIVKLILNVNDNQTDWFRVLKRFRKNEFYLIEIYNKRKNFKNKWATYGVINSLETLQITKK